MEILPVHFQIKPYQGKNEFKRHEFIERLRLKEKLEKYINNEMDGKDYETFLIRNLASYLNVSILEIEKILENANYEGSTLHVCTYNYEAKLALDQSEILLHSKA